MSASLAHRIGVDVMSLPYLVGTGGVYKYRAVIVDSSTGGGVGDNAASSVKLPTTAFTNGERFIGVCNGPVGPTSLDPATPNPAIIAGVSTTVRMLGTIAIQCDSSVSGTPILGGDEVALTSASAGDEGRICKATLSSNVAAANQHIAGIAMNKCNTNLAFVIVFLRGKES